MIYLIDNGEPYDDHEIYFVEAPKDFKTWFNRVYRPWVNGAEYRPLMIVGTTNAVAWVPRQGFRVRKKLSWGFRALSLEDHPMHEFSTMSVVDFLAKVVEQKRNGKPRPRYRLEVPK